MQSPLSAIRLLVTFLGTAALLFAAAVVSLAAESRAQPNVVVILTDDLGFSDVGCYGGEIETPHLDKLAAGGLRFTQFYNTARCWPTRCALLTGYYPQQTRSDPQQGRFPLWTRTLPHYLKPAGYRSYHSGKWHVSGAPRALADGGFDHSYILHDHDRNFYPKNQVLDDQPLPPVAKDAGYYSTTAIADHAVKCLREHAAEHAGKPFFSYVCFTTPHFPVQAPEKEIAKYRERYRAGWPTLRAARYKRQLAMGLVNCPLSEPEPQIVAPSGKASDLETLGPGELRQAAPWESLTPEQQEFQATKLAIHAAMVDVVDQEVGKLVAQLKAMGAYDNTLILFLSDNGASAEVMIRGDGHDPAAAPGSGASYLCLGPGGSTVCNTPFRRHKIWVHEGGVATPLIAHWPQGIAARGELRTDVGHVVDFVPTVLDLVGVKPPPEHQGFRAPAFPGRSLVPAFAKNGAAPREYVFFHHSGNRGLRVGDWKLVSAAREGGGREPGAWELYDLATDRSESKNLAAAQPERVAELAARWQALQDQYLQDAAVGVPPGEPAKGKKGKSK